MPCLRARSAAVTSCFTFALRSSIARSRSLGPSMAVVRVLYPARFSAPTKSSERRSGRSEESPTSRP